MAIWWVYVLRTNSTLRDNGTDRAWNNLDPRKLITQTRPGMRSKSERQEKGQNLSQSQKLGCWKQLHWYRGCYWSKLPTSLRNR